MNLFNEFVNELLGSDDISLVIEAKTSRIRGGSDEVEAKGLQAEMEFAAILEERYGPGIFWGKNPPKGAFTQAKEAYKRKEIFWHESSEHQDKILRIDFIANISDPIPEEEIEQMAKERFNEVINLDIDDLNSPEFMEFWEAPDYANERTSAMRIAQSTADDMRPIETRTFDVKGYKDDAKNTHGISSAVIVELVNHIGKKGSLYGAADFVAYRFRFMDNRINS